MEGRPPTVPGGAELVSGIVIQGTIGKCLEQALKDVVSESLVQEVETSGDQNQSSPDEPTRFDPDMAHLVLQAFGDSAAKTKWVAGPDSNKKRKAPPRVILRGSLDHYNRSGDRWRIVVNDSEIRPRAFLRRNTRRKRRDRSSLWEASEEQQPDASLRLHGSLMLLAYGDS